MNKLLWLVYPDFRVSNPYQDLLARALSDCGLNTRFGTITDALEATQSSPTVFHLHWEDTIYATASSENDARESVEAFLVELAVFREIGGLVVWTLHNAAPHEDAFPILSDRLRRSLAKQADIVHVHGSMASDLARRNGVSDERIILVPHPDIAPAYPNDIDDEAARRYFSLDHNETVFAFLGAVRSYKGVDMLLRAFAEVHRNAAEDPVDPGGSAREKSGGKVFDAVAGHPANPPFCGRWNCAVRAARHRLRRASLQTDPYFGGCRTRARVRKASNYTRPSDFAGGCSARPRGLSISYRRSRRSCASHARSLRA